MSVLNCEVPLYILSAGTTHHTGSPASLARVLWGGGRETVPQHRCGGNTHGTTSLNSEIHYRQNSPKKTGHLTNKTKQEAQNIIPHSSVE